MADVYGGGGNGALGPGMRVGQTANVIGGLVSLGLILGTAVWGYKLLVRDVTGVPVVRALEGPIRVAPENPGGLNAAHQGLSVNQVAADGATGDMADAVILAPPPLDLAAEDVPAPRLPRPVLDEAAPEVARTIEDTPGDALATDVAVAEALATPVEEAPSLSDAATVDTLALAEVLAAGVAPLSGVTDPAATPILARSLRPMARPAGLAARAPVAPNDPAATLDVAVEDIASGTRLVQLGAFDSAEVAQAQWDRIGARFEDHFVGKKRVVQRAQSGGKTFYRLRAMGFADLSDARRFCSALMAERADCIPVVVR